MSTPFLPSTPGPDSPAIRALLAPWLTEQQLRPSRQLQIHALNFWIEPLNRPPSPGGTFVIVWPEPNGEGRWTHNAHPDRTVMQTQAGDILINKGERWRVRAVKIYRSAPVLDERVTYWCRSVDDAIWDASR